MEEHFRNLIDSLNTIPSYKKLGESSRGKFELLIGRISSRIILQVNFIDKYYPEDINHILIKNYEFSEGYSQETEEQFIKSCYDDFIKIMLYRVRCELMDSFGNKIKCIPIADLIQYGIDEPKPESND